MINYFSFYKNCFRPVSWAPSLLLVKGQQKYEKILDF